MRGERRRGTCAHDGPGPAGLRAGSRPCPSGASRTGAHGPGRRTVAGSRGADAKRSGLLPARTAVVLGGDRYPRRRPEVAGGGEGSVRFDRRSGGGCSQRSDRDEGTGPVCRLHGPAGCHRLRPRGGTPDPHCRRQRRHRRAGQPPAPPHPLPRRAAARPDRTPIQAGDRHSRGCLRRHHGSPGSRPRPGPVGEDPPDTRDRDVVAGGPRGR